MDPYCLDKFAVQYFVAAAVVAAVLVGDSRNSDSYSWRKETKMENSKVFDSTGTKKNKYQVISSFSFFK